VPFARGRERIGAEGRADYPAGTGQALGAGYFPCDCRGCSIGAGDADRNRVAYRRLCPCDGVVAELFKLRIVNSFREVEGECHEDTSGRTPRPLRRDKRFRRGESATLSIRIQYANQLLVGGNVITKCM